MVDIRGPCAYDRCEALADEELVVEPCTKHVCALLPAVIRVRRRQLKQGDPFEPIRSETTSRAPRTKHKTLYREQT
ncbi:hypothetical protein F441_07500 [Phytophthora nicotianae CJ01A1]|uniref:Uncharacterized protein n=1 Tax=Phytophthora nicotianae CJ01A1 TaxID=1317063 RepID=W2X600_PHYNI|nr:hypothetical protein F441_07500 [Phytophthora nicotianae CJ01A1]